MKSLMIIAAAVVMSLSLAACRSDSAGGAPQDPQGLGPGPGNGGTGAAVLSVEDFFSQNLQSSMDFCRTCHIAGGLADVPDGRGLMLSTNPLEDYARLFSAWESLGEGVQTSPLLTFPGDPATVHSGGKPWPVGSASYSNMQILLNCWADPVNCTLGGAIPVEELPPLLGSARGGHAWFDYCEQGPDGQPRADAALLPADPRMLVQPGVNEGRAVYFNAWAKNCRIDPELVNEDPHPQNCGELRQRSNKGAIIMGARPSVDSQGNIARYRDGRVVRPASTFEADRHTGGMSYQDYNNLWQAWELGGGLLAALTGNSRPPNFDELVVERYGFGKLADNNPYPVNEAEAAQLSTTYGGSGRLPVGLVQLREPDGKYSGNIGLNCLACHGSTIDGEFIQGSGGAMLDTTVWFRDQASKEIGMGAGLDRVGLGGRVRGTNNAQFANVVSIIPPVESIPEGGMFTQDFYEQMLGVLNSGSTGTNDTPAWWNVGRRPVKFVDAMFPHDAIRVDLALFFPLFDYLNPTAEDDFAQTWVSGHAQHVDLWIMSLKSPVYPLEIDESLASQGAVLFHTKDLWAPTLNNSTPRPEGGNGSCASCHGVYSPRFVHDTAYLEDPALEGIASYVVPLDIIGTDPARQQTFNEGSNAALSASYVGYSETAGTEQDCRVQNLDELRAEVPGRERPLGYVAPPLYGIWATAPYLHNGSIPDVWSLLKSSERPSIWRRVSKAAPPSLVGQVVMGFDSSMESGFDPDKLGWRYDRLSCTDGGSTPVLECNPLDDGSAPPLQLLLSELFGNVLLSWNIATPLVLTNQDVENRKIYNTHLYSQGNGGHSFTDVLTDAERRAIIEYLKTL